MNPNTMVEKPVIMVDIKKRFLGSVLSTLGPRIGPIIVPAICLKAIPREILAADQPNEEDIGSINNPIATSPVTEYIALDKKDPKTTHHPRNIDLFPNNNFFIRNYWSI